MYFWRQNGRPDGWLFNLHYATGIRHLRRRIDFRDFAVSSSHYITHARRRRDQIEIEFSFQAFLHDLHVQQTEKAAAKSKPKRGRRLRLVKERGVIEPQLVHRVAQFFILVRIYGIESRKN